MKAAALAAEIEARVEAMLIRNTPALRRLRREYSRRFAPIPGAEVVAIALKLIAHGRVHRFVSDELVAGHPGAFGTLDAQWLERLGRGLASWDEVDCFACILTGPAWREGRIPDDVVIGWAMSSDRWWRRAALVSTVPLNVKARGGRGDTGRTLRICALLVEDRDEMVVKALSWALRALATRDAAVVQRFLMENRSRLPARVQREVRNKLETGRKNGHSGGTPAGINGRTRFTQGRKKKAQSA